jgi:hypothetical protein
MSTKLTYEGVRTAVDLEDHAVTLRPAAADPMAAAGADAASGVEPGSEPFVVIPRWEVEGVTVKPASLLGYGQLVITVRGGQEHTVEFSRDAQDRFGDLAEILR